MATLAFTGSMLVHGAVAHAFIFFAGSSAGFAGGAGMRACFYRGTRMTGVIIGLGILLAAGGAVLYFVGILDAFGLRFSADNWVFIAFVIGFLAARPEDAAVQANSKSSEDDLALGTIAPIAAELVAGTLTPREAEKRINDSALIAPNAPALWHSMSAKEREELGMNFMRLAVNPKFAAEIERQLEPLKQADPEVWEQSLAHARDELRMTQSKRRS